MKTTLTIEKVIFNIRTQALLNFTPIIFTIKHAGVKPELIQGNFWDDETHRILGKNLITFIDSEKKLREIKIINFPKEYDRLIQVFEASPHIIPQQFNILEAGLVNVTFMSALSWAHGKHIMPRKMQERSNYSG
jgi:hypothetical protein